ncbi:hypothetical protein DEU56DRAFT_457815 [Suillus clintonianus]|uniref:uncharacterized protein n=1 Tax=Suillus clintonianus TaxID=1904413 RepID=UPI001B86A5E5|nr:uncharacterized protein DEU56DRAFT_457815 [Suillus clintonianus]KAG2131389.1 hypothetical protein DEU56DRAFT_457815 [Suillus clintonianus]
MSSSETATVTGRSQYPVTGVDVLDAAKADTRRYGTFFPCQIPEGISFVYLDEEDDDDDGNYTDFESSWEFAPASVACAVDFKPSDDIQSQAQEIVKKYQEHSNEITEAQRIIQDYLQRHDKIEAQQTADVCHLNCAKELPKIPNHRDSTYTLAETDDGRSTIDLEKRPEPAIHLFHYDLEGVAQAQLQGLEMIQAGHSTPGATIRCQRAGCKDVLRDLEALKFHLHIHNIGDTSDFITTFSAHTQKAKERGHSSTESTPLKKTARKVHNRSKSVVDTGTTSGHSDSTHPVRKVHSKDPCSPSRSQNRSPTRINSSSSHTRTKLPNESTSQSRGRRSNRGTIRSGLGEAGHNDSIAMVLSRPASPGQSAQEALGSDMNLTLNFVNKISVLSPRASPTSAEKELSRATSPRRAFSPARALSPFGDRLRRVLSFGCLNE